MLAGILAGVSAAVELGSAISDHFARDTQADATADAASQALRLQRRDLAIRGVEESQAASLRREQAGQQAQVAQGTARASAASAGVRGSSAGAIEREIQADLARMYDSIDMNTTASLSQIQRMREGAEAQHQGRLSAAEAQRPSWLATGVRGTGALIRGWNLYQQFNPGKQADVPETEEEGEVTVPPSLFTVPTHLLDKLNYK